MRPVGLLLLPAVLPFAIFACKHTEAVPDAGAPTTATTDTAATATATAPPPEATTTAAALAPLGGSTAKPQLVTMPNGAVGVKLQDGGVMQVPEGGLPALGIPPGLVPSALPAFAVPSGMPTTLPSGIPTNLVPSAMPSGLKLPAWPPPAASK